MKNRERKERQKCSTEAELKGLTHKGHRLQSHGSVRSEGRAHPNSLSSVLGSKPDLVIRIVRINPANGC